MRDLKEPLLGEKGIEPAAVKPHLENQNRDAEGFRTPRWYGYIYQFLFVLMICLQQL